MTSASPLVELFLRARDRLETVKTITFWAVAGLLVLHAAVLTPVVEIERQSDVAAAERARLAAVGDGLSELSVRLDGPRRHTREVMIPALDRLVENVRGDLERLPPTRETMRAILAEAGAQDAEISAELEPFEVSNVDWMVAIGRAKTPEELREALRPLVEQQIVRRRFGEVQLRFTETALPRIEADLDAVAGEIPKLRGRFPEASEAWDRLATALAATRRTVRDLVWTPPERPDWWTSAEAGDRELLSYELAPSVEEQLRRPLELDEIDVATARIEAAYRELVGAVEARRASLAGELGDGSFLGLVRQTGATAPRVLALFPWLVGVVLTVLLTWRRRRLAELGLLARLLVEDGESPTLGRWWLAWLGGRHENPDADTVRKQIAGRSLGLTLLVLAWIGLAVYQLVRLGQLELPWLIVPGAVGAVLAAGAALAEGAAARRTIEPFADELFTSGPYVAAAPVSEPVEDTADDAPTDPLDGRPLER